IPSYLAGQDLNNRVVYTASSLADKIGVLSPSADHLELPPGFILGESTEVGPGKVLDSGQGLVVPHVTDSYPVGSAPVPLALILDPNGQILASSYPARYPVGESARTVLPKEALNHTQNPSSVSGTVGGNDVVWSTAAVYVELTRNGGIPGPKGKNP